MAVDGNTLSESRKANCFSDVILTNNTAGVMSKACGEENHKQ